MKNIKKYSVWIWNKSTNNDGVFTVFARDDEELKQIFDRISDLYNFYIVYRTLDNEELTYESSQDIINALESKDETLVDVVASDLTYELIEAGMREGI